MASGIGMTEASIAVMNIGMTEASIAGTFMIARKEEDGGVRKRDGVGMTSSVVTSIAMTGDTEI